MFLSRKKKLHSPDERLPPQEPQRLPQQPLISSTGARLVLCNDDDGYPSGCFERGRWVDNIESKNTKTFLRFGNVPIPCNPERKWGWIWPAVVLMPEEYSLRVGGMSLTELRSQLEKYWGQGGIPGATVEDSYQDMWVPGWCNTNDPYDISWAFDINPEEEEDELWLHRKILSR